MNLQQIHVAGNGGRSSECESNESALYFGW